MAKNMLAATTWHGVDLRWAYADLLRAIQRKTGCVHRACDVLHDSLVRLALATTRVPIAQPHAYLRTVVGSVLTDRYRDDARWRPLPDREDREGEDGLVGCAPSAERMAQLRACLEAAQRVFDRLPARRREVFWLFRIDGFSCREIAERLGLSVRTVENHVMRAMVDLRAAEELMA
jgi:RNA polymerase sigma-70 factor (ECF subfamily)